MIGQQEAGHRVDLQRGVDLIDARFDAFGAHRRGRFDEAEEPARRAQQPRRHRQRACGRGITPDSIKLTGDYPRCRKRERRFF